VCSPQPVRAPSLFPSVVPRSGIGNSSFNIDQPLLSEYVPQRIPSGSLEPLEPHNVLQTGESFQTWDTYIFDLDFGQVDHEAFSEQPVADQTTRGHITADELQDLDSVNSDLFDAANFECPVGNRFNTIDQTTGLSKGMGVASITRHVTPSDDGKSAMDTGHLHLPYSILEEM
jgi:hypothetical protein